MKIILGTKIGMTQIIGEDGVVTPVTILQAGPCTVTQTKTVESDGYSAVQLAFGQGKNLSKAVSGHVKKPEKISMLSTFANFVLTKSQQNSPLAAN